ncbi:hypothetical protein NE237_027651 [Protea cynaroides]|uniref:Uncharacterized protein n=1 Tax=Protea cynaroides TaxID=273540 RepID=A0A9Q0GNY3_9MAGN|nr:hypothetical protein NE237_027651 [Protea cynaroides]
MDKALNSWISSMLDDDNKVLGRLHRLSSAQKVEQLSKDWENREWWKRTDIELKLPEEKAPLYIVERSNATEKQKLWASERRGKPRSNATEKQKLWASESPSTENHLSLFAHQPLDSYTIVPFDTDDTVDGAGESVESYSPCLPRSVHSLQKKKAQKTSLRKDH